MPATRASILGARAVCIDSKGNTYIAEREGNGIRKVDADGIMSTYAGTGERGYEGDGGSALEATWGAPKAIRCDLQDNLIVVDTENPAIRRIDAGTGLVTTSLASFKNDGPPGPSPSAWRVGAWKDGCARFDWVALGMGACENRSPIGC